ncbi:mechanosensitive ion channel family protein [Lysobacter silvisoli]|nr:mechanosensitive ion channel domain-containing protein [Lysobacter silvisoli]
MLLTTTKTAVPLTSPDWDGARERMLIEVQRLFSAAPLLLAALLMTLAAWWLGGWLSRRAAVQRVARRNPFLKDLLASSIKGGVALLGLTAGLQLLNATAVIGAVLGTAGVVGIALGFAFKDIVENYIAGVLLSLRQPFRQHDHVRIAEHEGLVMAMTARATVLMTLDGNNLRVPNAIVFKSVILNYTQNPSRRFEFDLSLAGEGAAEARLAELRDCVAGVDGVLADPPVETFVQAYADGKQAVRVRAWIDQRGDDIEAVRGRAIAVASRWEQGRHEPPMAAARKTGAASASNSAAAEQARQHLVRAGSAASQSRDLLDATAPTE